MTEKHEAVAQAVTPPLLEATKLLKEAQDDVFSGSVVNDKETLDVLAKLSAARDAIDRAAAAIVEQLPDTIEKHRAVERLLAHQTPDAD